VEIDISGNTLPKKIRTAQLAQINFIFGACIRLRSFCGIYADTTYSRWSCRTR
jgi:hypothetical protein